MDSEESKKLQPGMRVRITNLDNTPVFLRPFAVGDIATLVELDTSDDKGDWLADFENGNWYIEPAHCDFEVVEE